MIISGCITLYLAVSFGAAAAVVGDKGVIGKEKIAATIITLIVWPVFIPLCLSFKFFTWLTKE